MTSWERRVVASVMLSAVERVVMSLRMLVRRSQRRVEVVRVRRLGRRRRIEVSFMVGGCEMFFFVTRILRGVRCSRGLA